MMKNLKVKKSWNGKVAIRDKYFDDAIATNTGIVIECMGEVMTIPADKVKYFAFKSNQPMKDTFSGESHYLYYYSWRPDGSPEAKKAELSYQRKVEAKDLQAKLF